MFSYENLTRENNIASSLVKLKTFFNTETQWVYIIASQLIKAFNSILEKV